MCSGVILIMTVYYFSRKKRLPVILFGTLTGFLALVLFNKYGSFIGAELPLNAFNTVGSVVLGVPFVVCMVILKFI